MLGKILESPLFLRLSQLFQENKTLIFEQLWSSPKAFIASLGMKVTGKNLLILTGGSPQEGRLYHDFKFFSDAPILDFPAWETLPSENVPPSPDIVGERYAALAQLRHAKTPHLILSSLQACLQKLVSIERLEALSFRCQVGETLSFHQTIQKFEEMGYQRRQLVTDKGEFAVRGGIIDVFPTSTPDPYRLEFWGDELESLRAFDPVGQKSVKEVKTLTILPGQELELLKKEPHLATLLDYLGKNTLVVFDDLLSLEDRYASLTEIPAGSAHFLTIEDFLNAIGGLQKIYFSTQPIESLSEVRLKEKYKGGYYSEKVPPQAIEFQIFNRCLEALRIPPLFKTLQEGLLPEVPSEEVISGEELFRALEHLPKEAFELHFLSDTEAEQTKLERQIRDFALHLPKKTFFHFGYLSSGFLLPDSKTIFFPATELTNRLKIRRQKQRSTYHTTYAEVHDLAPGDLVVHYNHGIGRFLGLEKRPNHQGILSEFFIIEYAESGKLFVPMQQAYLISKYIGSKEEEPHLHVLGGTRWKRTRDQTQAAILGYASELLDLYAHREIKGGFVFRQDSQDLISFEEDFPYVETEDQLIAIRDVKADMVSQKAMDRLVCGDVGYGKTEVAMRAAFKAVVDGDKQVAILVPTTVLAMQHYENFIDRMSNFPLRIGVLSRFRTPKQIKETLKGLGEGSIDIVIGTHRLVSEDVIFRDLGLIIIDEEQRFGVKAKEHLKKIKVGVDCLTLSATPIPRTLYMSLVGARDMSVISSPPQDRLPIKTIIAEPDLQLIKNALLRELARDGQAYFIHNRVETIYEIASKLKELLPQARIGVGHGQMHSDELDLVFHAFKRGDLDILVATSIIENGIDIPNANTIFIDRADRLGLADLYQMRGRVGRWNRRAYAYFLVPKLKSLPEISRKRMQALAESSGYGGGMKVAMRDLEIRGAGDILGIEQSGHVSSIGFHLYCKMLKRTIQTLQGKLPSFITEVKIEIPVDARLPEEYIGDVTLRLEIYQRLGEMTSFEDLDEMWKEVKDRFGAPPLPAEWLYYLTYLKIFAQRNGFTLIKVEKMSIHAERIKGKETVKRTFVLTPLKKPGDIKRLISALKL